jgi:hypothetical protein
MGYPDMYPMTEDEIITEFSSQSAMLLEEYKARLKNVRGKMYFDTHPSVVYSVCHAGLVRWRNNMLRAVRGNMFLK